MIFVLLVIVALFLTIPAFMEPWPKWVFWAVALGLFGLVLPLAWIPLLLCVVVRGMAYLFRATHAD